MTSYLPYAGREHPEDCGILNCDHPVHFGRDSKGKMAFGKGDKKCDESRKKKESDGGARGQGSKS